MQNRIAGTLLTLALSLILAGCPENPTDSKPKADIKAAKTDDGAKTYPTDQVPEVTMTDVTGTVVTKKAPGDAFTINTDNTTIGWVGSKVTGRHNGGFRAFDGQVTVADGKLTGLKVVIDITSVWADNDRLTGHLKTDDFFNAGSHPKATFTSTKIGDGMIEGHLTIRNVTKLVSFPASIDVNGDRVSISSEFALNRRPFGLKWEGKPNDLVRDLVLVKVKSTVPLKAAG